MSAQDKEDLMTLLRELADATNTLVYQRKMIAVKKHSAFPMAQKYLERYWLNCQARWVKALQDKTYESGNII